MRLDKTQILLIGFGIILLIVLFVGLYQRITNPPTTYKPDGWYGFMMAGKVPYIGSDENMKAYLTNKGYPICEYVNETIYQVMSTYEARTDKFVDYAIPNIILKIKTTPCYTMDGSSIENASLINIHGITGNWRHSNEFIRDWKGWN